ncbi:hypothetical protein ACP70R_029685 [Stipagrostis hirtigluma subsp. patula]
MASRKATAIVASAMILALVFLSCEDGVEGWCISYAAPDPTACHAKRGLYYCTAKCQAVGFKGGLCMKQPDGQPGDCFCVNCADQQPPPPPKAP